MLLCIHLRLPSFLIYANGVTFALLRSLLLSREAKAIDPFLQTTDVVFMHAHLTTGAQRIRTTENHRATGYAGLTARHEQEEMALLEYI